MDGFEVARLLDTCRQGDIFITLTGDINVIDRHHFLAMKDGAIVCNAGHFDAEVNKHALEKLTVRRRHLRPHCVEHRLRNGRTLIILAEGRLVNLAAAEGHPPTVMDMSFANQARAAQYLLDHRGGLERRVHRLPDEIDQEIAALKLRTMGIRIDRLTAEQRAYISSWRIGT